MRSRRLGFAAVAGVALLGAVGLAVVVASSGRGGGARLIEHRVDRAVQVTFADCAEQPAFAPDGARVAYVQRRGTSALLAIKSLTSPGVDRTLGPGESPAFSPDGRRLAALVDGQVVVHDLERPDEPPRSLGPASSGPSWLGDRELVVAIGDRVLVRAISGGGERLLGRVPDGHVVRAIAVGADHRVVVLLAGFGEALVAELRPDGTTRELRRGVLASGGLDHDARTHRIRYLERSAGGADHIIVESLAGGERTALATERAPAGGFDVSADGTRLAFSSCADVTRIVSIDRDGRLGGASAIGVDRRVRVTRDGMTVVFLRDDGGGPVLHRVPATGGVATPIGPMPLVARAFDVSPAGDGVVYVAPGNLRTPLWRVALDGSWPRRVDGSERLGGAVRSIRFAPDGRRLLALDGDRRILELTLATGEVLVRWDLAGTEFSAIGQIDYDADGERVLASLSSRAGDLWIADGAF